MKAVLVTLALGAILNGYAQNVSKNPYDINFSKKELEGRMSEPKGMISSGFISGREVEFTVSVNDDFKGLTLMIFPMYGTAIIDDSQLPETFLVRDKRSREYIYSGKVVKLGKSQYYLEIAGLPRGNYVLTVNGLQSPQPITFSNY